MRRLSAEQVDDILVGATILGCGGGGWLADGREQMKQVYDAGHAVTLAGPDDLAGTDLVACPYAVGAMTAADAGFYGDLPFTGEHPTVLAVRALEDHLGRRVAGVFPGEIGGGSIGDAFYAAAMMDVPVIDADPAGRAVPEIEHSLLSLHGVPSAPLAVVNEVGDTAIFTRVADDARAETLIRALAVASRNAVWVADHGQPWGELRDLLVPGSVSRALAVGRARREAAAADGDISVAVATAAGGWVTFRGEVEAMTWDDADGFSVGETTVAGAGESASSRYRVWFKNENLMAWRDGDPDITCPDLICMVDAGTGMGLTNPEVAPGASVAVVGVPCDRRWRTAAGIALLGPAHFGFDVDYMPLDERAAGWQG